jgi:hypothetical protein
LIFPLEPAGTFPNAKVTGNCPSWVFDSLALEFQSGHVILYRGFGAVFPAPNGVNAEGVATLLDNGSPTSFVGQAHAWFGQNANPTNNGQFYFGETVSFKGTATDGSGSTISFTTNPGGVQPASGKGGSGWGQQNLSCNIVTPVG